MKEVSATNLPPVGLRPWTYEPFEKLIVIFDMLSSANLLNDLTSTNNVPIYLDLFDEIKNFFWQEIHSISPGLEKQFKENPGSVWYNFVGDGVVLLFPPETDGRRMLSLLAHLSRRFRTRFKNVVPYLSHTPEKTGLTFGMDFGTLYRSRMMGNHEWVGIPLCIASRLQRAVKAVCPEQPAFKMLASSSCSERYLKGLNKYDPINVESPLTNLRGAENFPSVLYSLAEEG